jgi:hypothetical protein
VNNNYNSNTVVKQDFAVVKQVDGQAAHTTNTTRHQSWIRPWNGRKKTKGKKENDDAG